MFKATIIGSIYNWKMAVKMSSICVYDCDFLYLF